MFFLGILSI